MNSLERQSLIGEPEQYVICWVKTKFQYFKSLNKSQSLWRWVPKGEATLLSQNMAIGINAKNCFVGTTIIKVK